MVLLLSRVQVVDALVSAVGVGPRALANGVRVLQEGCWRPAREDPPVSGQRGGRGKPVARRNRRRWLLQTFGDGVRAPCQIGFPGCVGMVDENTLTVDRWPLQGRDGGRYTRGNIRPACQSCNVRHATNPDVQYWLHRDALDRRGRAVRL